MLPLDQIHLGLVRGWQCACAFCWRSETSYETAEKSMPLCLKTLENALLSSTVWTVPLDMRGLHNLLFNFLIQLSTLISHVLFSPDILFHIFVMLSVGCKIIGGIFITKILIWPPITQYHYSLLSRLDVHAKMFTSKVMHNQIVLCKPFMNNLCNQEN